MTRPAFLVQVLPPAALAMLFATLFCGCTDGRDESHLVTTRQSQDSTDWVNDRVNDLVAQMTLEEKLGQLQHDAPAIERLGIARYNYWNEGLHGVLTNAATSFPSPIALGATWDPDLVKRVASAISDEARGIHLRDGKGLTYWSPVINMLRDPRWGRYDESFGEDPFHMSEFGVAFVRGLQGDDPKYLKTVATPKHFALNNSEYNRHNGTSDVDERQLFEYYLPAFEATVEDGKAFSVMAAYNRVNGVPASANTWLLDEVLREQWGFRGYVVSDCDAVADIANGHQWTETLAEAAAKSLIAGTDLNCGTSYPAALGSAINQGLVTEADLDVALTRVFRARFLLGEFDSANEVPYQSISTEVIESVEHANLALEAAKEAIVLLKNDANLLPLDRTKLKSIAVIGPHGDTTTLGSYSGNPTRRVSALSALTSKLEANGVTVSFAQGTSVTGPSDTAAIEAAVELARDADVALVFAGTELSVFREEMDRPDWALPGAQQALISAVVAANPRTVLALVTGGPLGVDWAQEHVPAILTTFYNGQEQGTAIADVLFGDYNPGGKLSTTWYKLDATLPPIGDYDLRKGRTYLYYSDTPLYPFGHGLSYTQYAYGDVIVSPKTIASDEAATVSVKVTNSGERTGDEIVQLYVRALDSRVDRPLQQLRGFTRLHLEPGETKSATFKITGKDLAYWDDTLHAFRVEAGQYELRVGASSADLRGNTRLRVSTDGSLGAGGSGNGESTAEGGGSAATDSGGATAAESSTPKRHLTGSGCDCEMSRGNKPFRMPLGFLLALVFLPLRRRAHQRRRSVVHC